MIAGPSRTPTRSAHSASQINPYSSSASPTTRDSRCATARSRRPRTPVAVGQHDLVDEQHARCSAPARRSTGCSTAGSARGCGGSRGTAAPRTPATSPRKDVHGFSHRASVGPVLSNAERVGEAADLVDRLGEDQPDDRHAPVGVRLRPARRPSPPAPACAARSGTAARRAARPAVDRQPPGRHRAELPVDPRRRRCAAAAPGRRRSRPCPRCPASSSRTSSCITESTWSVMNCFDAW